MANSGICKMVAALATCGLTPISALRPFPTRGIMIQPKEEASSLIQAGASKPEVESAFATAKKTAAAYSNEGLKDILKSLPGFDSSKSDRLDELVDAHTREAMPENIEEFQECFSFDEVVGASASGVTKDDVNNAYQAAKSAVDQPYSPEVLAAILQKLPGFKTGEEEELLVQAQGLASLPDNINDFAHFFEIKEAEEDVGASVRGVTKDAVNQEYQNAKKPAEMAHHDDPHFPETLVAILKKLPGFKEDRAGELPAAVQARNPEGLTSLPENINEFQDFFEFQEAEVDDSALDVASTPMPVAPSHTMCTLENVRESLESGMDVSALEHAYGVKGLASVLDSSPANAEVLFAAIGCLLLDQQESGQPITPESMFGVSFDQSVVTTNAKIALVVQALTNQQLTNALSAADDSFSSGVTDAAAIKTAFIKPMDRNDDLMRIFDALSPETLFSLINPAEAAAEALAARVQRLSDFFSRAMFITQSASTEESTGVETSTTRLVEFCASTAMTFAQLQDVVEAKTAMPAAELVDFLLQSEIWIALSTNPSAPIDDFFEDDDSHAPKAVLQKALDISGVDPDALHRVVIANIRNISEPTTVAHVVFVTILSQIKLQSAGDSAVAAGSPAQVMEVARVAQDVCKLEAGALTQPGGSDDADLGNFVTKVLSLLFPATPDAATSQSSQIGVVHAADELTEFLATEKFSTVFGAEIIATVVEAQAKLVLAGDVGIARLSTLSNYVRLSMDKYDKEQSHKHEFRAGAVDKVQDLRRKLLTLMVNTIVQED